MHLQQQIMHLKRPDLLVVFIQVEAIPQQVRSADTVLTGVVVIAGKPIMHAPPLKARPDADLLQRLLASLRVPGQMGQPPRTVDVHPAQLASHTHPRLVPMLHPTHPDPVGNALDGRFEDLSWRLAPKW